MTIQDRLRLLASALPSDDSAVTLTRADLVALLDDDNGEVGSDPEPDLTANEVAEETLRAPSTVRGWLIDGALRGYKLNGTDWRIPRSALREYLTRQVRADEVPIPSTDVDITDWRSVRGEGS